MNPSPDDFKIISGMLALAASYSLGRQIYWQLRATPDDGQRWSAVNFLVSLLALILQLGVALLGGPPLSLSPRGLLTWTYFCISAVAWSMFTERHNQHQLNRGYMTAGVPVMILVMASLIWLFLSHR